MPHLERLPAAGGGSAPPATQPEQALHGDYQEANLFFAGDRVSAIIDGDQSGLGPPAWEVARTLQLVFNYEPVRCRRFLRAHRAVRPLPQQDIDAAVAVRDVLAAHGLWVLETLYLAGDRRVARFLQEAAAVPFVPVAQRWARAREACASDSSGAQERALRGRASVSTKELELRYFTGRDEIDDFVRRVIGGYEKTFPDRVRAYYVIGSYADGSATGISDLDLVVLFKGTRSDEERRTAGRLDDGLASACPVRLDLTTSGEDDATWEKHHVKRGSQFLYGQDIRSRLPERPLDPTDVRESFHCAQGYLQFLRGGAPLAYPPTYPDPAGEFFGYDAIREPSWYPAGTAQGLRELVNAVTLAAAALLPPEAGRRSATKGQTVALYSECVGGRWARYVEQLYQKAKIRWGYLVPEHPDERRVLRKLCEQTLGFENHVLEEYRALLSNLLRSGIPESVRFAEVRPREVQHLTEELPLAPPAAAEP